MVIHLMEKYQKPKHPVKDIPNMYWVETDYQHASVYLGERKYKGCVW